RDGRDAAGFIGFPMPVVEDTPAWIPAARDVLSRLVHILAGKVELSAGANPGNRAARHGFRRTRNGNAPRGRHPAGRAGCELKGRAVQRPPNSSHATTGKWSLGNWPFFWNVTISVARTSTGPRERIQSIRRESVRASRKLLNVLYVSLRRSAARCHVSLKKPSPVRIS